MVAYGNIFLPRPSRLAVLDLRAKAGFDHTGVGADLAGQHALMDVGAVTAQTGMRVGGIVSGTNGNSRNVIFVTRVLRPMWRQQVRRRRVDTDVDTGPMALNLGASSMVGAGCGVPGRFRLSPI